MLNGTSNGPIPGECQPGIKNAQKSVRGTHFEPDASGTNSAGKSQIASKLEEIEQEMRLKNSPGGVPWIKTPRADSIFGSVIMLNSLFLGIDVEFIDRSPAVGWVFWAIESVFLVIFLVELVFPHAR